MSGRASSPLHAVSFVIQRNGAHGVTRPTNEIFISMFAHICEQLLKWLQFRRSKTAATVNGKFARMNWASGREPAGIKIERVDADHSSVELGIRL